MSGMLCRMGYHLSADEAIVRLACPVSAGHSYIRYKELLSHYWGTSKFFVFTVDGVLYHKNKHYFLFEKSLLSYTRICILNINFATVKLFATNICVD